MSFSKCINRNNCRKSLINASRNFSSGESAGRHIIIKQQLLPKLRMSVSQWKLISQIKDQLTKTIPDKNLMFVVNKEWVNLLKRLPAISSQTTSRNESSNTSDKQDDGKYFYESISELPQAFTDLKSKFTTKAIEEEKSSWKVKKNVVSDLSIKARTKYILNSVSVAESETSRVKRLEDLVEHFIQYPDGVGTAVRNGAIPTLLNIRQSTKEENVLEIVREALAILGFVDPLPGQGIRILSIDGGGVRGLLVMEMLVKLEELTGKKVHEMFDYICGVSTGSIIACTIGASGKSINDVSALYKDLSTKVFNQNAFFGARSLFWSHGYYDTSLWEKMLKEHVGDTQLIKTMRKRRCPKIGAISTVTHEDQVRPFIFRNYELPYRVKSQYLGTYKHRLWEAARASAAAPTYFEEFRIGDYLHQDGGILVNNPTAVALHEAKQLWPNSPIQCVVSFGTGRIDPATCFAKDKKAPVKQTSWKEKFFNILVSATDTEAVHLILNDLLPPSVYFRFNPYVTELLSMDEYQPEKLALMQKDALMYIRRNEEKFQEAATALTKERTTLQKFKDWVSLQSVLYANRFKNGNFNAVNLKNQIKFSLNL